MQFVHERNAVAIGQPKIDKAEIKVFLLDSLYSLARRKRRLDFVLSRCKLAANKLQQITVVIHY
jgi:hypothetical protein